MQIVSRASLLSGLLSLLMSTSVLAAPPVKSAGLVFQKNDKLVIIGDSITDAGRKPAGEGLFDARVVTTPAI